MLVGLFNNIFFQSRHRSCFDRAPRVPIETKNITDSELCYSQEIENSLQKFSQSML